jgi:flagellar basal body rod protein FlgG
MNIGLYQSAASLSALERWQEVVAQNITSSQVAGFRKRTVEFSSIEMGSIQADSKARSGNGGVSPAMFPSTHTGVSFQPGETTPTRRELDVALEGDGFFEVQMPDGTRGYTRSGEFHLGADRTILSRGGLPVLTTGGTPITMLRNGGSLSIGEDGKINQGDSQLGTLSVVTFADTKKLIPLGGGLFTPSDGIAPTKLEKPGVLQGYIEGSNVTPLHEMIALVQIARAYEANQKILTSRDQNLQKALEMLG